MGRTDSNPKDDPAKPTTKTESKLNSRLRKIRPHKLNSPSFDWAKFTNFKSRSTRQDLDQLFKEIKAGRRKELLERADKVGLYPIHWAAINNRADLIECLFAEGSSLTIKCANSLFYDGTPLHLAAMNGSLEAVATLLGKSHELSRHRTRPKSVQEQSSDSKKRDEDSAKDGNNEQEFGLSDILDARDADGQTPLMRTAAPRSKRWDTIRELLQKNFWSLSGRPAEVALLLICVGADWRQTEPVNGMNLMHLAITNDYDDIVSLLLVLDKNLIDVATVRSSRDERRAKRQQAAKDGFRTITLDSNKENGTKTGEDSDLSPTRKPLIDSKRENANDLISKGLKPIQLAILYSRVRMISLLWRPSSQEQAEKRDNDRISKPSSHDQELKRILIRACFSDNEELAKFMKPLLLKGLLAFDLAMIALIWAPIYCTSAYNVHEDSDEFQIQQQEHHHYHHRQSIWPTIRGGIFFVSYCFTIVLTLRVILKNPGFLRRHSVHYLSELAKLLSRAPKAREAVSARLGKPSSTKTSDNEASTRRASSPLIKLDDTTSIVVDGRKSDDKGLQNLDQNKKTLLAMNRKGQDESDSPETLGDHIRMVQHGVRQLCHRCQCIRRPRSKHCGFCDHCVQDFDHHCIYLGCCIGRNNRLDFLLAMIALSITALYGTLLQSTVTSGWSRFWYLVAFVWIAKYVIIGSLTAFFNLRRACLGVTLYEDARSDRLRSIFGRRGPPEEISRKHATLSTLDDAYWRYLPYDRSAGGDQIWKNLREFANNVSVDEYLLTFICTDTPLARSLLSRSGDLRIKQQQMHKPV